jgi:hypothetical protein
MARESSESGPELSRRDLVILAGAVLLGACLYLAASAWIYRIGFPLDDSWIHLTYARNLALHGQWAFQLGHPSAGSTAPLWTFLLAVGFQLGLAPYFWTYFLGACALFGLAILAERTMRSLLPAYRPPLPWVGLFFAAEWHLQWAATSGMETLLHALLATVVISMLVTGSRRYLTLGLLTGLSVWVRPDGLTLLGPIALTIFLAEKNTSGRLRALVLCLIGLGSLFVPYLLFNLRLSGTPMPNTFYAKQMEYASWQTRPVAERFVVLVVQLLTGPGLLLLPGAIGAVILAARRRSWGLIAAVLWCGGYLALYILRLPPYQHGRYLMPAMPVFFLLGLLGYLEFERSTLFRRYHWALQTTWRYSLIVLTLAFVILGARTYGDDVGLIESEMVVTARWVDLNLPPDAVIAAHDIGALGYFDRHPLIDLAGLVSPEVIPFIRDEGRLAGFLDERNVDYLIALPSFYPELTQTAEPIFVSGGKFAPLQGEKNMTVYRWKP